MEKINTAVMTGTWSGQLVNPFDLKPWQINIEDIANSLAKMCRWNGHCQHFYSVAEHSVYVANRAAQLADESGCFTVERVQNRLAGLLHDASESYLSDIPSPIKRAVPEFRNIEKQLLKKLFLFYGLPAPDRFEMLWQADLEVLATERDTIMNTCDSEHWDIAAKPLPDLYIGLWTWQRSRDEFLWAFKATLAELERVSA